MSLLQTEMSEEPKAVPEWFKLQRQREIELTQRILAQVQELSLLLQTVEGLETEVDKSTNG